MESSSRACDWQIHLYRAYIFGEADGPYFYAQRVLEAAKWWLNLGPLSTEEVIIQVALEQLLMGLPPNIRDWDHGHLPPTIATAVRLAEEHLYKTHQSRGKEARLLEDQLQQPGAALAVHR